MTHFELLPVHQIRGLYTRAANLDYPGEPVTQLEHAVQTASLAEHARHSSLPPHFFGTLPGNLITRYRDAAIDEGLSDDFVLAAFLHDIGHLIETPDEVRQHEKIGADFLRSLGLPESVAAPVEYHVLAKAYLLSTYSDYTGVLSPVSQRTWKMQQTAIDESALKLFRDSPYFRQSVLLRLFDDQAKLTESELTEREWNIPSPENFFQHINDFFEKM